MKEFDDIVKDSGPLSRILTQAKRHQERAERFEALAAPFLGSDIGYGGMDESTVFVKISSAAQSMSLRGRLPTFLKRLNHEPEFRNITQIQLYLASPEQKTQALPLPARFTEEESVTMQWSDDGALLMQCLVDNTSTDPAIKRVLERWLHKQQLEAETDQGASNS